MTKKELQKLKSDYQYCYGELIRVEKNKNEKEIKWERRFIGGYHRAVCTLLEVGHQQNYGFGIVQEWEEEVLAEWKNAEKQGRPPKRYW